MNNKLKLFMGTSLALLMLSQAMMTTSVSADNNSTNTGKWMSGEYHTHTIQSNDASEPFLKLENVLNTAFREDLNSLPMEAVASLKYGTPFDYLVVTDHLRNSARDPEGNEKATARWEAIADQQNKIVELQKSGKYAGKMIYTGFEWDMMGLDHASVGIIDSKSDVVPIDAIHQFEWLYSYDTTADSFTSNEAEIWGERPTKEGLKPDTSKTYEAIDWLKNNYPDSFVLPNHPSRHNGSNSGVVTIEDLRKMNDIAPNIVFGMEGMPGNQMAASENRSELAEIYGGADVMISQVGGIWDALLGEGRRFWNFTNSDFHFKVSSNRNYSSGYWPSEYSRNYTWVEGDTFKDVVDGMRSGKSFSVYGDLINALDFKASGNGQQAGMGEDLQMSAGDNTNITIRFKSPEYNNYAPISEHETTVDNKVKVDHIDLISGEVTGKLNESQYASNTTNDTTKIVKRFTEADWGQPDAEGYYTINYTVPADTNRYYRLRGTNLGVDVDGYTKNGEPLKDQSFDYEGTATAEENEDRFNSINDRNYTSMWFYSNPIFVEVPDNELEMSFSDVNSHWASTAINSVVKEGLFSGTSETSFSPDTAMSRSVLVTVMHRLAGQPSDGTHPFQDVATDAYYNDAVAWASTNAIVKGVDSKRFAPEQSITREQLAVIVYNYAEVMGMDVSAKNTLADFTDTIKISSGASKAMQWAVGSGLLAGKEGKVLDPSGAVTRAEGATILHRFINNI
ncbi:S-layer homology domain-containing protein [Paenibacillus sp. FSL K6-2524]|uniref:S-layer homology domain-containing protein n=1 Tax=Paenibacillus sp. FSL K6-2524 TaxID=2954516 RepID=UPI0030FD1207